MMARTAPAGAPPSVIPRKRECRSPVPTTPEWAHFDHDELETTNGSSIAGHRQCTTEPPGTSGADAVQSP